jgi:hypothetical protein
MLLVSELTTIVLESLRTWLKVPLKKLKTNRLR